MQWTIGLTTVTQRNSTKYADLSATRGEKRYIMKTKVNHEDYNQYKTLFAKYDISTYAVEDFFNNGGYMVQIKEMYAKANGKWSKIPYETETETITATHYLNLCTWIHSYMGFERVVRKHTEIGYIPVCMTSTRPDNQVKSVTKILIRTKVGEA